jgi:prepilin-type N-terminal cleavage/methylation domain-containing protein
MSDAIRGKDRSRIRSARRGFTLGEVLVTVALIAVLAAVVIPAVGSQITKGDQGRLSSDLLSMRSAIEQYISDVRRYPNSVGQLIVRPAAATSTSGPLFATTVASPCPATPSFVIQYTAQEVARWRGPYLNKDSSAAVSTGYAQTIRTCFDVQTASGVPYETILVPGIDVNTATALDAAMDDGVITTGALRWVTGGGGGVKDTLKFFAIPIQP